MAHHPSHLEWSFEGLIDEFVAIHTSMPDRRYAFVLGAGASKSSGILTGEELVDRWLREMRTRDPLRASLDIKEWASAERLELPAFAFERRAQFYSEIYSLRFDADPESGYAYLEQRMKGATPSFGYIALAHILANERHKVVITTNFDNLVADALTIYTDTYPLVCGHEALAGFVVPMPRRPIVAKVHRDLLLAPLSSPDDVANLKDGWTKVLRNLLTHYTPIVVGYGGNDGSLFGLLETLADEARPGPLIWCHHGEAPLDRRVVQLLDKCRGVLVRIPDFDTLMLMLTTRLGYSSLADGLVRRTDKRVEAFNAQLADLRGRLDERAGSAPSGRTELARTALAEVSQQTLLSQERATHQDPTNVPALVALASTHIARKEWDSAERVLLRLLDMQEKVDYKIGMATTRSNLGRVYRGMKRFDDAFNQLTIARELHREAASKTGEATVVTQLAQLAHDRGDREQERACYEEGIRLNELEGREEGVMQCCSNLARLAKDARDHPLAIVYFRRAADIADRLGRHRDQAWNLGNLGSTYREIGDLAQARTCYERALELGEELDDKTGIAITLDNLGVIAAEQGDFRAGETLFRRAALLDEAARKAAPTALHRINLGIAEWRLGQPAAAKKSWASAFALLKGSTDPLASRVPWRGAHELETRMTGSPKDFMPFI